MGKVIQDQIDDLLRRRDRLIKDIGAAPTATPKQAKEFQAIRAEIQKIIKKMSAAR